MMLCPDRKCGYVTIRRGRITCPHCGLQLEPGKPTPQQERAAVRCLGGRG
jgi:hypothetical protein